MSIKNSAGVQFNAATDLIIEADPDGTVTSCRNRANDTEYVGGGGGDFSVAHITVVGFDELTIKGAFLITGTPFGDVSMPINSTDFSNNIILYNGKAAIEVVNTPNSISGNITLIGGNMYLVTGDCTLNY